MQRANSKVAFHPLAASDRKTVECIATAAFAGSDFYQKALGFNDREFTRYWNAFFQLAFDDPASRVFVVTVDGTVTGALAVGYDGFPNARTTWRFLVRLLTSLPPTAFLRYLHFAMAYTRFMHRSKTERAVEACGLWLFVSPDAVKAGLGSKLVRYAIASVQREGKTLITGLIDANHPSLAAFYRRLGFQVTRPVPFRNEQAARIEQRIGSAG